jgi:hypothetical protein
MLLDNNIVSDSVHRNLYSHLLKIGAHVESFDHCQGRITANQCFVDWLITGLALRTTVFGTSSREKN